MKKIALLVTVLIISSLSVAKPIDCAPLEDGVYEAKVIEVKDGDTAKIRLNKTKEIIKVRFYGVDTPETAWKGRWPAQDYSEEAKAFTVERLSNKSVTVDFNGEGTWSRCVGEIFTDGNSHSLALVRGGYAWWYDYYAEDRKDLEEAQKNAKAGKHGLWGKQDPVSPWEYRKSYGK